MNVLGNSGSGRLAWNVSTQCHNNNYNNYYVELLYTSLRQLQVYVHGSVFITYECQ